MLDQGHCIVRRSKLAQYSVSALGSEEVCWGLFDGRSRLGQWTAVTSEGRRIRFGVAISDRDALDIARAAKPTAMTVNARVNKTIELLGLGKSAFVLGSYLGPVDKVGCPRPKTSRLFGKRGHLHQSQN
jgi:hypothetical protein